MNQELRDKLFGKFSGSGPLFDIPTGRWVGDLNRGLRRGELSFIQGGIVTGGLPKTNLWVQRLFDADPETRRILLERMEPTFDCLEVDMDTMSWFDRIRKTYPSFEVTRGRDHYDFGLRMNYSVLSHSNPTPMARLVRKLSGLPEIEPFSFKTITNPMESVVEYWDSLSTSLMRGKHTDPAVAKLAKKYEFNYGEWMARNSVSGATTQTSYYAIGGDYFDKNADSLIDIKSLTAIYMQPKEPKPARKDRIPHMQRGGRKNKFH